MKQECLPTKPCCWKNLEWPEEETAEMGKREGKY
jgi:hypothetical protein